MTLARKLISIFAILAASGSASAAVNFNETVHGDLSQGGASPTFSGLAGANSFVGTMSWTTSALDIDAFSFTLGAGESLGSFTFAFSNSLLTGNEQVSGNVFFYSGRFSNVLTPIGSLGWIARAPASMYGSSSQSPMTFTPQSLLGPGTYSISMEPNGRSESGGMVQYTLSFDVLAATVPEPGSLAMMTVGLAALVGVARRHRLADV